MVAGLCRVDQNVGHAQVLPRHAEDLEAAFVVLSGTVQVAFGALGEYAFSRTRQRTIRESTAGVLVDADGSAACGADAHVGTAKEVDAGSQLATPDRALTLGGGADAANTGVDVPLLHLQTLPRGAERYKKVRPLPHRTLCACRIVRASIWSKALDTRGVCPIAE